MMVLKTFSGHIPDPILEGNSELTKLIGVLDGMLKVREEELYKYNTSYLFPLLSDINTMRRYVDRWGAEYTEQSSRLCIDCLYKKYYDIYSRKGTSQGLELLLQCLFWNNGGAEPIVGIISYIGGKPLILSDDNVIIDYLPNGEDISNEVDAVVGEEVWNPTLLGDTWLNQYDTVDLTVDIDYIPSSEFLAFINSVIYLYLPMHNANFSTVNLTLI